MVVVALSWARLVVLILFTMSMAFIIASRCVPPSRERDRSSLSLFGLILAIAGAVVGFSFR